MQFTPPSANLSASQVLEKEVNLYRLLVDQVQDYAIFALDPQGHILSWNAGAERFKGYAPAEILGKHFSIFYPVEDNAVGKPAWELEVATAAGRVEDEGWRIRKDGSRFWANVVITAIRDKQGILLGFTKVTRDLTERRKAEEELRRSEERFRLLVHSVRDYAIFMLDPEGCVTTWNAGAERIKGYTAEEIAGKHFSVFYPLEELNTGKPQRELYIAATEGVYEEEGWRVRKDGTRFWANVNLTAIRLPDGTLVGFTKVTRDLTERRASEEHALEDARRIAAQEAARVTAEARAQELHHLTIELQRQREEADAANRTKGEFLAAMSHELRTPLNAIGGYAQLLELEVSGPVTPEQRDHIYRIQRSQRHLLGIINDILDFSRIEAGQVTYTIAPFVVNEVLDVIGTMILPQSRAKRLRLNIGSCPPQLAALGDRARVEQILLNLLSNTVKFTADGGTVDVMCRIEHDTVRFSVQDSGIGIPSGQLETIFAPFTQVGRDLAHPKEGTGLGLAISRDLARAMQGDLTVESTEGKGSTFTLILPIAV